MGSSIHKAAILAVVLALAAAGTAYAIVAEIGPTYVSATAEIQPRTLPKRGGAPIELTNTTRIGTHNGSVPPILKKIDFKLDKHGSIAAEGWPVCTVKKLADTTPSQARKRCSGALVGKGVGKAIVAIPGRARARITSPLSIFNGPKRHGLPTLIAHAYERIPEPKTLLVPIEVQRIRGGRYGYEAEVELPDIADGYGAPILAEATIGATRKRGGRKVGYLNAFCSGGRLQVYGTLDFKGGDHFPATLTSPCHSRG